MPTDTQIGLNLRISAETFASEYYCKQPLLVRGALTGNFHWTDANKIVERANPMSQDFKVSLEGVLAKERYIEAYYDVGQLRYRLRRAEFYELLRTGATVIVNRVKGDDKVEALARQLGRFFGHAIVPSIYVAFGDRDSFRAHWDTRDIVAVQLVGKKRWLVYEPSLRWPTFKQQSRDYEQQYPRPETPALEFVLEPGDAIYLPRGWWHNPLPVGEATCHLSFGVFPPNMMEYLEWTVEQARHFERARLSLLGWDSSELAVREVAEYIKRQIQDPNNFERFEQAFLSSSRLESPLSMQNLGNSAVQHLCGSQRVRISSNSLKDIGRGFVVANGTKVILDNVGAELLGFLNGHSSVRMCDLLQHFSGLDGLRLNRLIIELCKQDVLEILP